MEEFAGARGDHQGDELQPESGDAVAKLRPRGREDFRGGVLPAARSREGLERSRPIPGAKGCGAESRDEAAEREDEEEGESEAS